MSYFDNKIVVIFGATGVFGQHLARSLRERGADVRLIVRHADALPSDLRDLPVAEADIRERSRVASRFSLRDYPPESSRRARWRDHDPWRALTLST